MGELVTAHSYDLRIDREDFAKGLRELKKFAKESPGELNDPSGVLNAKSFTDALAAAWWEPTLDEHGDICALEYIGDKLPIGADSFDPFLRVLAKVTVCGDVVMTREEAKVDVIRLKRGKLYDAPTWVTFEQLGRPPQVKPGSSFALRFRVNRTDMVAAPELRLRSMQTERGWCYFDPATTERPPTAGITVIDSNLDHLEIGQEREVRIGLSPEARGPTMLNFETTGERKNAGWLILRFNIETPPEESMGWKIALHDNHGAKKLYLPADEKRTLLRLQRFAQRHAQERGGEFLAPVVSATSLDEALALIGLERTEDTLRFTASQLPGSEQIFWGVMQQLAIFTNVHHGTTLKFQYAHAPEIIVSYELDGKAFRRVEYAKKPSELAPEHT